MSPGEKGKLTGFNPGLVLLFWGLYAIVDVLKKNIWTARIEFLLYYYIPGIFIWIFLTYPVYLIFKKTASFNLLPRIFVLIFSGLLVGAFKVIISGITYPMFHPEYTVKIAAIFSKRFSFYLMEASIICWIIFIILFVLEMYQNYRYQALLATRLENQLAKAQLQALKMQLQPHFLFNAHNAIATLIRTGHAEQAIDMLSGLSDLLRCSLTQSEEQLIPLKQELELIAKYLEIEQIRFEDRLDLNFQIGMQAEKAWVPNLFLQPLVENAFKHGISKSIGPANLTIRINKEEDVLVTSIYNSGPSLGVEKISESQFGIGLSNTIDRMKQLFDGNYKLSLKDRAEGVLVKLTFPFIQENTKPYAAAQMLDH